MLNNFNILKEQVIDTGLCTHCGTCVGLNDKLLKFQETKHGPLPMERKKGKLDLSTYTSCPGKGVPYPLLNEYLHGNNKINFLTGNVINSWIGYSLDDSIRLNSASGGVITTTLIYLLNKGLIDGAIVVKSGIPNAESALPIIATTEKELIASAQSVYMPVPVNEILKKSKKFDGRLAFVGLPDQVASIRILQMNKHPSTRNIEYILGPYTGTNMYKEAIRSFLRGRGVDDSEKIQSLEWRAGEWPGYLEIKLENGKVFKAEKFYYNYLTPFFITKSSLIGCDFTNELTDISVGDAWSPIYEKQRKGFSIVLSRTAKGDEILKSMYKNKFISLESIELVKAMGMHGHMLDFKKRGSFIRLDNLRKKGKLIPEYGYRPVNISATRKIVEKIISGIFYFAAHPVCQSLSEYIPLYILGPTFNFFRVYWKKLSKPTKRKGLLDQRFKILPSKIQYL